MDNKIKFFHYVEEMKEAGIINSYKNLDCYISDATRHVELQMADTEALESFGGVPFIYVPKYGEKPYLAVDVTSKYRAFCIINRKKEREWMEKHPGTKWFRIDDSHFCNRFVEMTAEEVKNYRGL